MLDHLANKILARPLRATARQLQRLGVAANTVTIIGFLVGMTAVPLLAGQCFLTALLVILLGRIADGLDGALARLNGPTDSGAFLDIVLDFIFYAGVVLGFALADVERNGLAALQLLFAFIGSGSSFLAFAVIAARRVLPQGKVPHKGLYYLAGLMEGTETIAFFVAFCLFPQHFAVLAYLFAGLCWLTTLSRLIGGYRLIRTSELGD